MKKTVITIVVVLFFLISKAQVGTFLSLGSAISVKDSTGNFVDVKEWNIQEVYIRFNSTEQKIQFFSKGMWDRDTLSLKKEIFIVDKSSAPSIDDRKEWAFAGRDKAGRNCTVRLKFFKDAYNNRDGELRVEYVDRVEIFNLNKLRRNPTFNKS